MKNKTLDSQIIKDLISALGTNSNKLSKDLGYKSHMTIYLITRGTNNMSRGLMERIIMKFPNVNYNYLCSGEGSVLLNKVETQAQMNLFNIPSEDNSLQSFLKGFSNSPDQLSRIESKLDEIIETLASEPKKTTD